MPNPVLIELTRGKLVECVHTGAVAVARPNGELALSIGDVRRPVFPRSAVKAFQCLPLIESGTADRYGFGEREIALACASHSGTREHVALARAMLGRAGLDAASLGCGAHEPIGDGALRAFIREHETATALHNNCSGKHSGMVCTACHLGEPVAGYLATSHPVQQRIVRTLEEFTGCSIGPETTGIDGCSAPNFALPLAALAKAFACLVTGEGAAASRRAACERITRSCWAAPDMVAGPGRLDTVVMSKLPGRVFIKTGAEGFYCGALPELGLGIALKIDDGAKRASEATLLTVLDRLVPGVSAAAGATGKIKNWVGTEVGAIRPAADLLRATEQLKP